MRALRASQQQPPSTEPTGDKRISQEIRGDRVVLLYLPPSLLSISPDPNVVNRNIDRHRDNKNRDIEESYETQPFTLESVDSVLELLATTRRKSNPFASTQVPHCYVLHDTICTVMTSVLA